MMDWLTMWERDSYLSGDWLGEVPNPEEVIENRPDLTATPLIARSSDDRRCGP